MIFPEVDTKLGSLVRPVVTIDATHSMSAGHLDTCDFSVHILKALEESGIIYFALSNMVKQITDVSQR